MLEALPVILHRFAQQGFRFEALPDPAIIPSAKTESPRR
jgi:hypothetical protein